MKSRIYFALFVVALIAGLGVFTILAQDDTETDENAEPEEIVVQTMTVQANSPSDKILTTLKYSYSDFIAKNKLDRYFDITVESESESEIVENFINQEISNIAISRILTKSEIDKFVASNNKAPKVIPIFKTPVVVVVHKSNTTQSFDMETLKRIFTGEIKSWRELDEESVDDKIELVVPSSDTETYRVFKKVVLGDADFSTENIKSDDEDKLTEHVKLSGSRISFMSNCYVGDNPRVQKADIVDDAGNIYPMKLTDVKNNIYPLVVKTYFYYTEDLPSAFEQLMEYAKENSIGLNSYRVFRIVAID